MPAMAGRAQELFAVIAQLASEARGSAQFAQE